MPAPDTGGGQSPPREGAFPDTGTTGDGVRPAANLNNLKPALEHWGLVLAAAGAWSAVGALLLMLAGTGAWGRAETLMLLMALCAAGAGLLAAYRALARPWRAAADAGRRADDLAERVRELDF